MAKELGLTIKGKDEASKVIKGVTEETKGLTKATDKQSEASKTGGLKFTEMLSALSLAKQAMQAVEQVIDQTVGAWLEHTIAVSDFNAMIDGNIEETSVLMELYDDFGVTMDTGLAAMRSLAKNGYEPNIEGLIKLREQLDGTTNAADRLKLAQQLIGEQGIKQILPMLDQLTNEQLRNYIDTLTEAEMVTEKEEQAARDMRKALSDLGDQVDNVKMQVGGFIATGLLPWFQIMRAMPDAIDATRQSQEGYTGRLQEYGILIPKVVEGQEELVDSLEDVEEAVKGVAVATDGLSEKEVLQLAVSALLQGDIGLAQHYADIAYQIERGVDQTSTLIGLLDALNGKEVTARIMVLTTMIQPGAFTQAEIERQIWKERYEATPTTPTGGGTVSFRGRTFQDAYWRGDTLMVRGQAYGTFPGRQQYGGEFTVGGAGGIDSQPVGFMATPGEKVKVTPPGASDNVTLVEMRSIRDSIAYMVDMLPAALRDAVAQGM